MKTFRDVFGTYLPDLPAAVAAGEIEHLHIYTQRRELTAQLRFANVLEKSVLLQVQAQLRAALQLGRVLLQPHYPADQLLLRLGEVVVLLAVGDPVPEGEGLQHLAGLRLGLDAKAPQDAGAQVPPDRHGVQQGAVHIKNRALQSHGNSFRLLPMVPIVPPEQAKAQ